VLVTTLLSARTKDETTTAASQRLFAEVRTLDDLVRLPLERIAELIFPVGFYRVKAAHLKELPVVLQDRFNGRIPDTVEELCLLPGVGRKTANLVVAVAFDQPAICVDVHVHRISNRFGLVATRTPRQTEIALRDLLPGRLWKTWNRYLVSYGQTVCTPLNPFCSACELSRFCGRIGVMRSR
jgi:endonuclease III